MNKQKDNHFINRFEKRIKILFFIELFLIGYVLLGLFTSSENDMAGLGAGLIGMFIMVPLVMVSVFLSLFLITKIDSCNSLTRIAMLFNWLAVIFLINNVTN